MSLKSDWNYVKRAMRTPCHNGTIGMYVETGAVAAGIAALDLLTFGCREPLKHSAGRGQFADWFGTGNRRGVSPSPHRRPKGGGTLKAPKVRAGPSFFWAFEGLAERALLMLLLVEIAKDAVINWHSLLNAANGCDGPAAGYCEFAIVDQVIGTNPTDMLIAPLPICHGVTSDTRHIYIPQGLSASIGYHVNSQPWPPQPDPNTSLSSFLYDDQTGQAWAASDQGSPGSGGNGVTGFESHLPGVTAGVRKISVRAQTGSGLAWCTGGKLQVTLQGHEVKWFHPQNCFKPIFGDASRGEGFFS